jgi:hypothetical protein
MQSLAGEPCCAARHGVFAYCCCFLFALESFLIWLAGPSVASLSLSRVRALSLSLGERKKERESARKIDRQTHRKEWM